MAPSPKKSEGQAYPAELSLVPSLKSCLVNLPAPLADVLVDSNTAAQNVIVELTFRSTPTPKSPGKSDARPSQRSIYLGWTGFQSKTKVAPVIGRDGLNGARGTTRTREVPLVEIDSSFAQLLGLSDGFKVGVLLRPNPPLAHTINIEPLTSADWEIIELHANFLEVNMLSQVRALPNPAYTSAGTTTAHPLTLHLSPTSSANIMVKSLEPAPSSSSPYAKLSPDAEVIVAPKVRSKAPESSAKGDRSVKSGKSGKSTRAKRPSRSDGLRKAIYLRGVSRKIATEYFDDSKTHEKDEFLKVWVDWSVFTSKAMRGITWVWVSILQPAGLQTPLDPQQQAQQVQQGSESQDTVKPAARVVAQVCTWEDAPNSEHVALSSTLCSVLGAEDLVGETIRLEPAPAQVSKSAIKSLKVYPFAAASDRQKEGFRFGGRSASEREEAARRITAMFGPGPRGRRLLEGALTDGMLLPGGDKQTMGASWMGGLLRLDPPPGPPIDPAKTTRGWFLGSEKKLNVEVMGEVNKPANSSQSGLVGEPLPRTIPVLVGIDQVIGQLHSHIAHSSSVLLTGGLGAGKTSLAQLIGHQLQSENFTHTTYFPCRSLVTDETRISTIKDTLNRLFAMAVWRARFGGHSLVILDDLDKLCPVETELQVGGDNQRSRHISETFISIVQQHCSRETRVVLLATAQSKEAVNNVIIGGHVVREIINLSAPDKEARRKVLDMLLDPHKSPLRSSLANGLATREPDAGEEKGWLDGSSRGSVADLPDPDDPVSPLANGATSQKPFAIDSDVDLLDIAGQFDGFMPGDLILLVSRARSEAMIRTIEATPASATIHSSSIVLTSGDFAAALKDFTPASLRNVTLQHSSTTFSSIGGLYETRRTLLETLQYPTIYAPIFANSPLRLRSGLLLYGYPGCGKTLLASAVAGECGLNFISVKGPEILNKYIGASEKSVRDLFERAQAARPCVLFFDEFDSVAPKRGHDSTGVTDRVVNQLLTQMDGAEGLSGVYVLAATSRPDLIDPALLRPGRLDKSLLCDMPSADERLDILRAVSHKLKISPQIINVDPTENKGQTLRELAQRTEGYSGADLQAVLYDAHLEAIHDLLDDKQSSAPRQSGSASNDASLPQAHSADFTYFRYGQQPEAGAPHQSAAARATERAQIAATLAEHRRAHQNKVQKQRLSRQRSTSSLNGGDLRPPPEARASAEPVIEWSHIEKALTQTRPSISPEDRGRLARIYREFVSARNGEMPSGQGGNQIGGRTSLM